MVYGYHLFIKEMPRCFRFRAEDMNSLPMWVQIHGLPPDCWNNFILSRVASKIGIPIHMDLLTKNRKRVKYARVLVEIDATLDKIKECKIKLPIGAVDITFEYEQDVKFCPLCKQAGHVADSCYKTSNAIGDGNKSRGISTTRRFRSKSTVG